MTLDEKIIQLPAFCEVEGCRERGELGGFCFDHFTERVTTSLDEAETPGEAQAHREILDAVTNVRSVRRRVCT